MSSHRSLPIAPGAALLAAACTLTCAVVVLGCGESSMSAAVWDGVVRDSAGIEVVENFGTPLWREGERWQFTEILRIGTVEGEPEYEFGRITGMTVLADRRVAVADAMSHNLRFYSADGVYEQTVGTQGQGPGEFGDGPLGLLHGPGDTLLVQDVRNAQMHAIAPDGTLVGSFSLLPGEGYYISGWDDDRGEGRLVSKHTALMLPDTPRDTLDIVLARDVRGAVIDTVARIPTSQAFSRQGDATLRYYYRGYTDFDLCGDGLVTGRSDEYRLLWYGPDGAVRRVFSLAWEPLPLTEDDRSIIVRRWDGVFRQYQVPPERAAAIRSSLRFESTYPAYRRFICGPAATVLVQHLRPVRDLTADERREFNPGWTRPTGTLEWDVFDSEGRYLGAAALPGTDAVAAIRTGRFVRDADTGTWYMYTVWSDEQDVEYVVAWRLDGRVPD
jgi:hypothetical protein